MSFIEGAGDLFRVTTLDAADPPRDARGAVDYTQDFFGAKSYLTVSGQLEAEIGALALSRVYTFGPTFRAENSNTSRSPSNRDPSNRNRRLRNNISAIT